MLAVYLILLLTLSAAEVLGKYRGFTFYFTAVIALYEPEHVTVKLQSAFAWSGIKFLMHYMPKFTDVTTAHGVMDVSAI
jgi:hypothetical protein